MLNDQQTRNRVHFSPPVIAHRGASAAAPENTSAAFLAAKRLGFSWIECDVMLSDMGEIVVIHDDTLERTTNGQGRVIDCPYALLKTYDAGSWFHPDFSSERILTLEALLSLLSELSCSANIEIKSLEGFEEETVKRVIAILQTCQHPPILLSSFSKVALRMVRSIDCHVPLGLLMHEWDEGWADEARALSCTSVHVHHTILTADRIEQIKSSNYLLLAYTVNDVSRAKELLASGVDAVFSDCLKEMVDAFGVL